jgi:hypothetical protein
MNRWTADLGGELTIGGDSNPIQFREAPTGLGMAPVSTQDVPAVGRAGVVAGVDVAGSRETALPLQVLGADAAHAERLARQIQAAWRTRSRDISLALRLEDSEYLLRGRPRRCEPDYTQLGRSARVNVTCSFVATDPAFYSTTESVLVLTLVPPDSTGRMYPAAYPASFGGVNPYTPQQAVNVGTLAAPWRAVIYGPVTYPRLINWNDDGRWIGWDLTLGPADRLEIDSDARSVLLNGVDPRFHAVGVGARWWQVQPGGNEILLTQSGAYSADARAELRWRSADN